MADAVRNGIKIINLCRRQSFITSTWDCVCWHPIASILQAAPPLTRSRECDSWPQAQRRPTPFSGSSSSPSTSTAKLCMMESNVRTTRKLYFIRTTTPAIPANAPDRMRARCPTFRSGCGWALRSERPDRSVSISDAGNDAGSPPVPPTTARTPGTSSTGTRCAHWMQIKI
jgi:hypothetical protein